MKKVLMLAMLVAVAGVLAIPSAASARVGDILDIEISGVNVTSEGDSAVVRGRVFCDRDLEYGMGVKVTQDPVDTDFQSEQDSNAEGVTVSGPGRPELQDDQPCPDDEDAGDGAPFDVTVQLNDGSAQAFEEGEATGVQIGMGTQSAGAPDPFIGDLEFQSAEVNAT